MESIKFNGIGVYDWNEIGLFVCLLFGLTVLNIDIVNMQCVMELA